MKKTAIGLFLAGLTLAACQNSSEARYLDLNTGEYVNVVKDSASGQMVNAQNGKPIEVYVDTRTHDTIWGTDGKVVNGNIVKSGTRWNLREESTHAADGTNTAEKVKVDGDGEVKIKDGNYTKKVEKDGDIKIETGTKTIKIDGETGERKVKKDHNIGDKIKKIF